jgi:hypothetical protein
MCGLWVAVAPVAYAALSALSAPIAAQPLETALVALAEQTQWQILYVGPIVAHRRSAPVPAGLAAQVALQQMLVGTGLRFELLHEGAVRLVTGPTVSSRHFLRCR